jgi:transcriptional regulator with XRE-family HTH domain
MELQYILKELLKEKGITITFLAKNSGVPLQTIHGWLSGSKPKNIDQVKIIADYFNVTIDYLCFAISSTGRQETIKEYSDEINAGQFEVILRPIKKHQ